MPLFRLSSLQTVICILSFVLSLIFEKYNSASKEMELNEVKSFAEYRNIFGRECELKFAVNGCITWSSDGSDPVLDHITQARS